jgi:riboflavin biosynthesis pyrimidine reductase
MPRHGSRPHVVANFASTLDGVVALDGPGLSSGGEITGFDPHDRLLMGILRGCADAVVLGAGTFRAVPRHIWTSTHVYPPMASAFAELRNGLGLPPQPLNVIVTSSGDLDLERPLFTTGEVPVLIVTNRRGSRRLAGRPRLPHVRVTTVPGSGPVKASAVLAAVASVRRSRLVLVEGGPHFLAGFLAERRVDELFLTLAPQIAGRKDSDRRFGLVMGRTFAPEDPRWAALRGVRRSGDFLFLRYALETSRRAKRPTPRA